MFRREPVVDSVPRHDRQVPDRCLLCRHLRVRRRAHAHRRPVSGEVRAGGVVQGGGRAIRLSKILSHFCSRGLNHHILYLKKG